MTTASAPAVEVQNVSKWYGSVVAVNEASFDVYPGVTGILGPNGAGKTTLLSMMCGLVRPSRGSVRVLGQEARGNIGLYRRIGVMLEHDVLYSFMTGREFVRLAARLQGVNDEAAVDRAIHAANLEDAQHRPTGTYSRGMRQRIRLAGAIVHEPEVLILDEPLNGTDPRQRVEFADFVARLSAQGKAILISSHVLEEVEALADRILLVVSGKLAASGDFHAIREKLDERPFQVRIGASKQREMAAALVGLDAVESVSLGAERQHRGADPQRFRAAAYGPETRPGHREQPLPHRTAGRLAGERLLVRGAAVIGALFMLAFRQAVTRRKLALLIILALLPLGLAVILSSTVAEGGTLIGPILGGLVISVTLPITVMVLATGAFGNEVEDRTLSLLTTKPVPRWTIVLAKFSASVAVAAPLMAVVAAVITTMDAEGTGNAPVAAAVGVVVGVVAYTSAFTWLGLLTTRALGFGLVYVLLWEALITSFLSGTRYLSIRSYIFGTAHGLNDQAFGEDLTIALTPALVGAALVTVVFFLLTTRRLSRMDIQ